MTTKMHIRDFGDALIATRDLDPVYCGLVGQLPEPQLCRWLLAYWCFYHVGAASWLSEQEGASYWTWMKMAAINTEGVGAAITGLGSTRWPRAAERRHFRGQKCLDAVEWFEASVPVGFDHVPESWVRSLRTAATARRTMELVQRWPMFGPWIAFKAADMMDRCYPGHWLEFPRNLGLIYEEPRKALDMLVAGGGAIGSLVATEQTAESWYDKLLLYFSARRAPPLEDRPCGPQEVETVLCKWKSHQGGHYWVGKDIHEQREALAGWGATAQKLMAAYPQQVPAQRYA